jgi:endoglycosylceramidase
VRRWLVTALVLASVLIATAGTVSGSVTAVRAGERITQSDVRRVGAWLVDRQGRVVVMHGFDVVRKTSPFLPSRFGDRDAQFLVRNGFNSVRIGLIWAAVEPRPGKYDDTYIRRFAAFNDLLARHGIHALIDFHQDTWSEQAGGDGAPGWATSSGNLLSDFQSFWDNAPAPDGVGIQAHFVVAWKHVVRLLDETAGARHIIGFDPFNEPYAGLSSLCAPFTPCPGFESGELASFYQRVIAAIRSTGDRHVVYPEGIAQNGIAEPQLPKYDDGQTVFTFHYYCPITQPATSSSPVDVTCGPLERHGLRSFLDYDKALGVPGLLGEFSGDDANDDNAAMVDRVGQQFLSWAAWMYYTARSDPANLRGQGLLRDDNKPGSRHNAKPGKLAAFEVPYPQAIAGTPVSSAYDRSTHRFVLVYRTRAVPGGVLAPRTATRIFVPRLVYPHGYRMSVQGARRTSKPDSQYLRLLARSGVGTVRLTVQPTRSRRP